MQHKRDIASYLASYLGTARRFWLPASLPLSIAMFAAYPLTAARAQATPPAQQSAPPAQQATAAETSPDAIKQREQELEAAREQQRKATELQEKLKADVAAIGQDRSKLNQQLIDIAGQVRGVETRIADAEARLQALDGREREIRGSLDSRRSEVIEVLAALQRAGRRTPPALLVRPEDALQSLRTAMLLGAVVPELRVRAEKLAADLGELVALRKTISTERDALAGDRDKLREDQTRLAALVDERQRQQSAAEKDMEAEGARAITLSKQADNLQSLIAKMEQDLKSAAKAAATASLQGAPATVNGKPNLGALKDPARLSPAVAFASAKGLFSYPVNGTKIREFGGSDGAGGVQKGISLAAKPGAQVTTPCDGWVVYAGPFRSYGQLLILNAGGGYHVLIAGMERISVNIGQFVLTGEPVATMGSTSQVASILATNASQPVLYVEFRKDGTPIDPGPWWAANEGEKVRG
ncbi:MULTISPECIES: murein hydrolase activator EnvC family protein [unclassified Bradyrhizobium]|uniref:murein hydrolase activator EnvC family protein n=1 Tax=unclassified Bradyrhizobium TaxID=2631580 RepID=UPI0006871F79|nr:MULTISPECIES: peptidoglycan DD-metalloendopeptidase family protein [unclassified Bradyrhizobium]QIG96453.1 peptidoglycan DD-metalloendopeptidase family protein [Bradyrhizobium sp. 6(2017)]